VHGIAQKHVLRYVKYIRNILKNRKLTGKEVIMGTNKTKNTDLFLIDPRNIVVVDGFNVRRDFDLDELKEQIKAKGVLNPLTVIAFKDDEGNEKYKLVDGERRYRATMLAISEGADIPYVRAMKARKDASTEELYIQQMMRNEGKKFTEYECAIMFRRFKEEFGYSQVEIADKFKKSPAFISKCLSLLDLPPYIQERIMKGELSVKAAKEIAANYGSEKEQVKAAKSAVDNAKENGRVTATNKEVLNSLKDSKEAKAIAEALRKVWAYLDGEVIVDVDKLARLLDKTESLSQAMREYKKGGIK
jgi:stage 0 sporulation protein J